MQEMLFQRSPLATRACGTRLTPSANAYYPGGGGGARKMGPLAVLSHHWRILKNALMNKAASLSYLKKLQVLTCLILYPNSRQNISPGYKFECIHRRKYKYGLKKLIYMCLGVKPACLYHDWPLFACVKRLGLAFKFGFKFPVGDSVPVGQAKMAAIDVQ
jgi:hypothetical protein